MKAFRFFILSAFFLTCGGCSVQFNSSNSKPTPPQSENVNVPKVEPTEKKPIENKAENNAPKKTETANNATCYNLQRDDLFLDKKQTFAIDFPPFEKSCFVTFHNPEFDNPPLGSQFFIYQDGKEVFEFPEPFGGGNTLCWADAVAFEDLNGDQLKDVIIVGKCGEKSGGYHENMVYLNNGKEFTTNTESNAELLDFSKINQIKDFVKKNPKMFVP
jgi:hypothetical protein